MEAAFLFRAENEGQIVGFHPFTRTEKRHPFHEIPKFPHIARPGVAQQHPVGVGLFHLQLATPSWRRSETRPVLLVMAGAALLSQDMLVVLIAGCVLLAVRHVWHDATDPLWRQRSLAARTHETST